MIIKKKYLIPDHQICFYVAIYINLWPLVPTGSIFNNWLGVIIFLPIGFKRLIIFPVIWRIIINSLIHLTLNFITKVLLKLLPNRLYAYLKKLYRNFYPEYEEYDEYKRKINLKIKK